MTGQVTTGVDDGLVSYYKDEDRFEFRMHKPLFSLKEEELRAILEMKELAQDE